MLHLCCRDSAQRAGDLGASIFIENDQQFLKLAAQLKTENDKLMQAANNIQNTIQTASAISSFVDQLLKLAKQ
jgi:hypothetical protein